MPHTTRHCHRNAAASMTLWKLHLWAYALGFPVSFGAKNYSVLAAFIWLGFVAIGAVTTSASIWLIPAYLGRSRSCSAILEQCLLETPEWANIFGDPGESAHRSSRGKPERLAGDSRLFGVNSLITIASSPLISSREMLSGRWEA